MSRSLTKGGENEWDKNVPPILDISPDRRGFLTPPEGFLNDDDNNIFMLHRINEIIRNRLLIFYGPSPRFSILSENRSSLNPLLTFRSLISNIVE
ncbi:MAG: hypothetical protein HZA08_04390 [Nitrospirae bacterium]|nr:hypothetical protein [Nitrospirota bacterium]